MAQTHTTYIAQQFP